MIRHAMVSDIPAIQVIRNSVKENVLSDPALVSDEDCANYITIRGRGWVYEMDGKLVGFAIADRVDRNIWALFVLPGVEKMGIGRKLHDTMMDWYFSNGPEDVWLSTSPGTRAELFYRKSGWTESGIYGKGEIKFTMTKMDWNEKKNSQND